MNNNTQPTVTTDVDVKERNARESALSQLAKENGAKLIVPKRKSENQSYILKFDFAGYSGTMEQCEAHLRAVMEHRRVRARDLLALLHPVLEALDPEGSAEDVGPHNELTCVDHDLDAIEYLIRNELSPATAALMVAAPGRVVRGNEVIPLTA